MLCWLLLLAVSMHMYSTTGSIIMAGLKGASLFFLIGFLSYSSIWLKLWVLISEIIKSMWGQPSEYFSAWYLLMAAADHLLSFQSSPHPSLPPPAPRPSPHLSHPSLSLPLPKCLYNIVGMCEDKKVLNLGACTCRIVWDIRNTSSLCYGGVWHNGWVEQSGGVGHHGGVGHSFKGVGATCQ